MTIDAFLEKLSQQPDSIEFSDTMAVIEGNYSFTPTEFRNGDTINEANQNNGSCKIFAFGQLNDLSEQQTLACFGGYYRDDVLGNPEGDDHQNIRNFIKTGWAGIQFSGEALTKN
ncbi:MAG: HopJ type III effector protein [Gammaproteobacteria bacterium]|nr:HopJ type III effector protein [Gammaproteobacteria bacterium]MDH5592749.1 HopJ type III effector protein [Gammaproteobacteria bacterium]